MTTQVFVLTLNGGKPKWSRYLFPFSIDCFAQLGNDLYLRCGDVVRKVSEVAVNDEVGGEEVEFDGTVWWPWLDAGRPGKDKMLESFDMVATGSPSVSIGYNQRDVNAFTTPYAIDPDTLTGDPIPMPLTAPTFSVKATFTGGEKWTLKEFILYVLDL